MILHSSALNNLILLGASLLLIGGEQGAVVEASTVLHCPPSGSSTIIAVAGGGDSLSLTVKPTTAVGNLCTLTVQNEKGIPIPVARSYDGKDWELTAGPYVNDLLPPDCSSTSSCTITGLPVPDEGFDYILHSYEDRTSAGSPSHDAARFLEQATFGQLPADIEALAPTLDYASWITDQVNETPLYHREYFRKHAPTHEYPMNMAVPGPQKSCMEGSHWRRYALSARDGWHAWKTKKLKFFKITSSGGKYFWSVNNKVRTSTTYRPKIYDDKEFTKVIEDIKVGQYYAILEAKDKRSDCIGCPVTICRYTSTTKVCGKIANAEVNMAGFSSDYAVVDLPPIMKPGCTADDYDKDSATSANCGMVSIDNGPGAEYQHIRELGEYRWPNDKFWLRDNSDVDQSKCNNHPGTAAAAYTNKNSVGSMGKISSMPYTFPPIFGKALNLATNQYEYMLFDPQLHWFENTIENPASDGGGYLVEVSGDMMEEKYEMFLSCANVYRHQFNQKGCKLSTSPYACSNPPERGIFHGTVKKHGPGVVVCGSAGEVGTDPSLGTESSFDIKYFGKGSNKDLNYEIHSTNAATHQKMTIWGEAALFSKDQLRQRIAWVLYQIIPIRDTTYINEYWIKYYDIYVRHAFGSYLDVLMETAFSENMGNWLSHIDNKALQYQLDRGTWMLPDENFARELMQLFTVGLDQLNMDGTLKMKADGSGPEPTYDQEIVMSMARVWTGLSSKNSRTYYRGNAELGKAVEPMYISPTHATSGTGQIVSHDLFPKSDLHGGYIGDGVGLCADLPHRDHLRKGAVYRLLGSRNTPELQFDYTFRWEEEPNIAYDGFARTKLEISETTSPLYNILCAPDLSGDCTYPGYVELEYNLDYSSPEAQSGLENQIDTIRVIKIHSKDGSAYYYEFLHVPCVGQEYLASAKKVFQGRQNNQGLMPRTLCADPRRYVARDTCCDPGSTTGSQQCVYYAERVKFSTSEERCAAVGKETCIPTKLSGGACNNGVDQTYNVFANWVDQACSIQAKISLETGQISAVHAPANDPSGGNIVVNGLNATNPNYVRVAWKDTDVVAQQLGTPSFGGMMTEANRRNACNAIPGCSVAPDQEQDGCLCDVSVYDTPIFTIASNIATKEKILDSVKVGSFPLDMFDDGDYFSLGSCGVEGVEMHARSSSGATCTSLDQDVVFVLNDHNHILRYFKNLVSTVSVNGLPALSFRNPVNFNDYVNRDTRDMYYEMQKTVEHLFHHPSHPPFLAYRFIQRFGTSNPSPQYIERASTAYRQGSFTHGATSFGSGQYGNLEALVAAVLLDPEARSPALDNDPTHGHLREPIIKMTGFLRSLDGFHVSAGNKRRLRAPGVSRMIGQGPYEAPSVFSFFLPEYQPAGWATEANIVSPEALVLTGKRVTTMIDSMLTMTKFGLTSCHNGVGNSLEMGTCPTAEGNYDESDGWLRYAPQEGWTVDEFLDDLSLGMTAGRLSEVSKNFVKDTVQDMYITDKAKAVRIAIQLVASTPEFHGTNLVRKTDDARVFRGYTQEPKHNYKAVVFINLQGGADSFNMLVPVGNCAGKNMYSEYARARGSHAMGTGELLTIDASGSGQVCNTFGVHQRLPSIKALYDAGDAAFFANMGSLAEPMTKHVDWKSKQRHLFGHNTMQKQLQKTDMKNERPGSGVGGRIMDMLRLHGYQTSAATVNGNARVTNSYSVYNNPGWTISTGGSKTVDIYSSLPGTQMLSKISELNGNSLEGNSIYADTWSHNVAKALFEYRRQLELDKAMETNDFNMNEYGRCGVRSQLCNDLRSVAEYIKSRHMRKVDRDFFYVEDGASYDSHRGDGLDGKLKDIDPAIMNFVDEMKRQNLWDNVVIVQASEFGRSVAVNSNGGTDHAWGGHYFVLGGSIKGKKIYGEYPADLSDASPHWVMNGRFIPTTPWDSLWNAVGLWLGLKGDNALNHAIPNRDNFGCSLLTDHDLFTNGNSDYSCTKNDADGDGVEDSQDLCENTGWFQVADSDGCSDPTMMPTPAPVAPTVTPTYHPTMPPHTAYDAEEARFDGSSKVSSSNGVIYVNMGNTKGSWVEFFDVDGGPGGECTISFRYSNGGSRDRPCTIKLNGVDIGRVEFPAQDSWSIWAYDSIDTTCTPGANVVRMTALIGDGGPNLDQMTHSMPGELAPPTPPPTNKPTKNPTPLPTPKPTTRGPTPVPIPTMNPTHRPTPEKLVDRYEAEGAQQMSMSAIKLKEDGYDRGSDGQGYVDMGGEGSYIQWSEIDGGIGGTCTLNFRYALSKIESRECTVTVNGAQAGIITFDSTDSWEVWSFGVLEASCNAGMNNVVRLTAGVNGGPNVDYLHLNRNQEPTPPPTRSPTPPPTPKVTAAPTASPEVVPTPPPTANPTPAPITSEPTVNMDNVTPVASVLDTNSEATSFGCSNSWPASYALDGTTTKFTCSLQGPSIHAGFEVRPSHGQFSVAQKLRVYSLNNCPNCDPIKYKVEGRTSSTLAWSTISEGDITWDVIGRNGAGLTISSTYESGDSSKVFAEVLFANSAAYAEYKLTFPETRSIGSSLAMGEIELPGMLVDGSYAPPPPVPPTTSPSAGIISPTPVPTDAPVTTEPISAAPTVLQTAQPITSSGSIFVANVLDPTKPLTTFGCDPAHYEPYILDGTTFKWMCNHLPEMSPGFTSESGSSSIVDKIRVYSHNNCPGCDPVKYKVEGRSDSNSDWMLISQGDLPWKGEIAGRNSFGLPISSSYQAGASDLTFTEASFTNTDAYLQYKVSFAASRSSTNTLMQLGEVELPGQLLDAGGGGPTPNPPTPSPIASTSSPTLNPPAPSPPITAAPTPLLTPSPVAPPTPLPTSPSGSTPTGTPVKSVLPADSTLTGFGGCGSSWAFALVDQTTTKFTCTAGLPSGFEVVPSHGQMSIVKSLRVFSSNTCSDCDPVAYILEGRVDSSSPWVQIAGGDLPWKPTGGFYVGRNAQSQSISSSYEEGDSTHTFTEASFAGNNASYLEYKVTITETRNAEADNWAAAEIELPGLLL